MELNDNQISSIIEKVLQEMNGKNLNTKVSDGIFETMDEAVNAAEEAQKKLVTMDVSEREKLIAAIRKVILENAMELAALCAKETKMGRVDHKYIKLKLVAEKTPGTEVLKTNAYTGDNGLTLVEMGPYGVIGAITPSTNPAETVACNSIGMIAAGNSVVFSPHPGAVKCSLETIKLINKAIKEAGGPDNLITSVTKPSIENTNAMMEHPKVRMLVATGGPGIVKIVLSSGKKAIGAGAGNPPVVVDETADIKKAAMDIIKGCSFDNNLPCIAEKEAIIVEKVYHEFLSELDKNNCVYKLSKEEVDKLCGIVLNEKIENGVKKYFTNKDYVGKDAFILLQSIGVNASKNIECLVCTVENEHPFVQEELMMPILPIVKAKDFNEALDLAVQDEHGNRHTAIMHSKNVDNLTKMARIIDTTIFVKNAPSYAGIGFGGEGHTTFTIAGPTGEGLTNPISFTRKRRCTMADSFRII
ncbi:aldehyde dehydrogenase family protein [Clostridium cochlearium]|uniref:aldehyde dehydrogenase family protein n=1 Tax=Clostridium cochlearium TaxID=1494 RepID=UPI000B94DA1F|nr:aldehyde dehydrogenase family protein [Clostridium cochlearium]MBV1818992.1 aldehyde dehydrogenase EutE [Bacteroidales bacterium MSK.15.36]NSJ91194.1 aldehyde dehydrogenase EutE [Coprococcus sp. MSK.21.13]MCG4572139.1 aldehyde dehydrogenase EutE [Clostridium cochlearium]MCG4580585.1 aldehyde dehydrogenase EutE [Clostridium cochlearium]NME96383.1 aldehyde dehydrogenase EutE [Clostridium cochlearium]